MGSSGLAVIATLSKDHNAPLTMPPNILTLLLVTGPGWRKLDETTVVTDTVAKICAEGLEIPDLSCNTDEALHMYAESCKQKPDFSDPSYSEP
jgi:hypothetical protein